MKTNKVLVLALTTALFGCASVGHKDANSSFNQNYKIEATKISDLIQADNAEQYHAIGLKYSRDRNYGMAIIAYQKALKLDPNLTKSISNLASIYSKEKMHTSAIPLFEKVVRLEPNAVHYNNLGYAYYLNDQLQESERVLKQAIIIDNNYFKAHANLALIKKAAETSQKIAPVYNSNNKLAINEPKLEEKNNVITVENNIESINENLKLTLIKKMESTNSVLISKNNDNIYELKNSSKNANDLGKLHKDILPASVINQSPQAGIPATTAKDTGSDWRPDSYIVKKSDTLSSIGLACGYDYKEIAAANNIPEPFTIKIGQRLSFASLNNDIEKIPNNKNQDTQFKSENKITAIQSGGISFKHIPILNRLFNDNKSIVALNDLNSGQHLQVLNGNGLKGIAETVAKQLNIRGIDKVIIADAKRFNKYNTYINYKAGYRDDALKLTELLLRKPILVKNDNLPKNVAVRLVLARDLFN